MPAGKLKEGGHSLAGSDMRDLCSVRSLARARKAHDQSLKLDASAVIGGMMTFDSEVGR